MKLFTSKDEASGNTLPANAYPCLPGEHIIKQAAGDLAKQIHGLVSVTHDIYAELYLTTLHRFAEFCQSMPFTQSGDPHSLLIQQLKLCIAALQLRRGLLLPKGAAAETIAEQEPLWTFALFSASLLYQVHKIQDDRQIFFYNMQGECIGRWHPVSGTLFEPKAYFTIEWKASEKLTCNTLMASIATQMLNTSIIRWLSQENSLLNSWWDAITVYDSNNCFIKIIQQAAEKINSPQSNPIDKKSNQQSTSGTKLEQSTPIASPNEQPDKLGDSTIVNAFLVFLESQEKEICWLRVNHGLLIRLNIIDEFLKANQAISNDKQGLIELIKPFLLEEKSQYQFCYRPLDYVDRRIIEGIIIKEESLSELWKKIPINTEFKPAINL